MSLYGICSPEESYLSAKLICQEWKFKCLEIGRPCNPSDCAFYLNVLVPSLLTGLKSPPECWLSPEKATQQYTSRCWSTPQVLHKDTIWIWQTFLKYTLCARCYSELFGLKSQGWLSNISPSWLNVGSNQIWWNKNESDNVSSDCRWEKRWNRCKHQARCGASFFWPSFLTPADTPNFRAPGSAHQLFPGSLWGPGWTTNLG